MAYPQGPAVDPLFGYFSAVAGQDQQIDAVELQKCLTQSGLSGNFKPFNLSTCRCMITMLDRDASGKMGFNEFKELWSVLNQWKTTFMQYDRDRSGTIEANEYAQALTSFGYNLSPQALQRLLTLYSHGGRMGFDDFIEACVVLRGRTDHFRRRDVTQTGNAAFTYNDFVMCF